MSFLVTPILGRLAVFDPAANLLTVVAGARDLYLLADRNAGGEAELTALAAIVLTRQQP